MARLFCKKEEKKHGINYILFENGRKIFTMQNVAFCIAKDGILHAERWPFGRQLTVFWKAGDSQLPNLLALSGL